jgi:hypothetical protein
VPFSCGDHSSELLPVASIRDLSLHRAAITQEFSTSYGGLVAFSRG